jgi:hypothetical protein
MSSDDRKSPKDQPHTDDKIKDLDAKKGAKNDEQVMGGRATADSVAKKADLTSRGSL